jgi:hypothetical protein
MENYLLAFILLSVGGMDWPECQGGGVLSKPGWMHDGAACFTPEISEEFLTA